MSDSDHRTASWRALSRNPNSDTVQTMRRRQLGSADWTVCRDRVAKVATYCAGVRVLDVGALGFGADGHPSELFQQLALVARDCVGIDISETAVGLAAEHGFKLFAADVQLPPTSTLTALGPFDVVTAGEVLEHLECPVSLFRFASALMEVGGLLVLTTPNPYAPGRVRSGWIRHFWESADHLYYAFPSGIAEIAERTGFRLVEVSGVHRDSWRGELARSARALARRLVKLRRYGCEPSARLDHNLSRSDILLRPMK